MCVCVWLVCCVEIVCVKKVCVPKTLGVFVDICMQPYSVFELLFLYFVHACVCVCVCVSMHARVWVYSTYGQRGHSAEAALVR